LLDQPMLISQLIGLVRKGEKIDHANGEHDDHSNAAAGALTMAAAEPMPFCFYSGGRAIRTIEPIIEEPSLVERAAAAVGQGLATIGNSLSSALSKSADAADTFVQVLTHSPTAEEIQGIESLADTCRSPEQQAVLEAHYRKLRKNRQPSEFESEVLNNPMGVYWPNDQGHRVPIRDLVEELEQVRATFQQWR